MRTDHHPVRRAIPWLSLTVSAAATLGVACALQPVVAALLAALFLLGTWTRLCYRRPVVGFTVIVTVVVFGSHILALVYAAGVPAAMVGLLVAAKDVLAWTLLAALGLRAINERRSSSGALLHVAVFVALCGILFLVLDSPAPLAVQAGSIRGALIPVLALGCVALLNADERRRVAVASVYVVAIAAAYALFELTLPRSVLVDQIGIGRYWVDVKGQPLFVDAATGLPGNFFTTAGFPRLTGTFGDPLSAGEVLAAALILAVAYHSDLRQARFLVGILSVALLLTFTRNGWMLAAVVLLAMATLRYGIGRTLLRTAAAALALVGVAYSTPRVASYVNGILSGSDSSTLGHQQALQQSFALDLSAFGRGWGTGGAAASNSYSSAVTSENSYVALLTQVGWVGLVLLAIPLVWLCMRATRREPLAAVGVAVLAAQAVTGFISENPLTFNGGFVPFATAGLVVAAPPVVGVFRRRFTEVDAQMQPSSRANNYLSL